MHYLHHYPDTCYTYDTLCDVCLLRNYFCKTDIINIHISIAIFAHVCGLYTKYWRNPLRIRTLVNRILLIPEWGFRFQFSKFGRSIGCPLVTKLREIIIQILSMNYKTQYIRYTSAICNKMNARQHFFWLQEHIEN